ncbi:MAG TPA: nitroreductase/quinone reductase family protein [Candidatus Eisenbacteria bacterium]|nr:nitroreductase/quinone reductase family protein [Candidatus Eisenbacteria bacterium]
MPDPSPNAWEDALIEDLRANDGRPSSGPLAGHPLLVMTSTGAKSGKPRRAILTYTRDGDDYIVAGTKGGSPEDPLWIENIRVRPDVNIEIGTRAVPATATIVNGEERDRLWDAHAAELPWFAPYPARTGRVIPMIRLTPVSERIVETGPM